jgi:hypothetical protein
MLLYHSPRVTEVGTTILFPHTLPVYDDKILVYALKWRLLWMWLASRPSSQVPYGFMVILWIFFSSPGQ